MRPALVLLNGVPASGKSTLARAWCARHADRLPLALDLDVLRSMLGGWRDALPEAGLAARAMALAAIGVHLRAGRDVIVPQYLRREEFVVELRDVAEGVGATFVEVALVVDARTAGERFRARARGMSDATGNPHGELEGPIDAVVRGFERFLATRPGVIRVTAPGSDGVDLLDALVASARASA
ncbi:AAA family ATPase [Amnibacterium sp. CER49]|uniref:AAA family ATPase n=1 Tax=Amnibacterium sp. CER49 TaxID=3039161 RepID=UPI002449985A|nr:AAA family ATPase [Amnibacterium sp. CER49]MDH2444814.1 AAA family ATPase [Amnibacterium sp. CER49]